MREHLKDLEGCARAGLVFGAAAYVLNYAVVALFIWIDDAHIAGVPTWKLTGWALYNSHFAGLTVVEKNATVTSNIIHTPIHGPSHSPSAIHVFLTPSVTSTIPSLLYLIVPYVVLAGSGAALYKYKADIVNLPTSFIGASVAVGYVSCLLFGAVLFQAGVRDVTIRPALLDTVVFGSLYATSAGWLGAYILRVLTLDLTITFSSS